MQQQYICNSQDVWLVCSAPMTLASHMGASSNSSCSSSYPAFCQCASKAVEDEPNAWAPVTHVGDLDAVTYSGLWTGLFLAICSHWGSK